MNFYTIIAATLLLSACSNNKQEEPVATPPEPTEATNKTQLDTAKQQVTMPAPPSPGSQYTFQVIAGEKGTFGYEIYVDGKKTISQPNIPAVPGIVGFAKKEDAEKVAALAIEKMKKGVMPPTIEPTELRKMGVLK